MKKTKIKNILERTVRILIKEYKPEKIILFGSYCYENANEDSDIDLLIIKNTDQKNRVDRFVEVKRIIYNSKNKIPISPLILTAEEINERLKLGDDFLEEIINKGKVLYER
ncbi:MAG: nucleotidyltransferase domain-containing protein [bacterium]